MVVMGRPADFPKTQGKFHRFILYGTWE
jgi:hypothetical protein